MNAADAAGREDFDAGAVRDPTGGSDGGGAVPFPRDGDRQIANADLSDAFGLGYKVQFVIAEPYREPAIQDCDGGGSGASVADDLLESFGSFKILWARQAVSNNS